MPETLEQQTNDVEQPREIPLTARQRAFVSEYLVDLNGTQAAIRAGYSPTSAAEVASEALRKSNVAAAIEKAKASRAAKVGMTAEQVVHELAILAGASIEHFYVDEKGNLKPTPEAPEGAMRAIKSLKKRTIVNTREDTVTYEVEFTLWDKPGQLKLMGKHSGVAACFDKVEISGKDGGPIQHAVAAMPAEALSGELHRMAREAEALPE